MVRRSYHHSGATLMIWRYFVAAALALTLSGVSRADAPAPEREYFILSNNGHFDPNSVTRSVSHYQWQGRNDDSPCLSSDSRFEIRTIEDRIVRFDAATGAMLQPARHDDAESTAPQVIREDVDDVFFAMNLFRENGIGVEEGQIERVVRDPDRTLVWTQPLFAELPVFFHRIGYAFDRNRRVVRDPETGDPLLRGDTPIRPEAFPIDHRPDIEPAAAIETWLTAARRDSFLGAEYASRTEPSATLGFFDLAIGTGRESVYRLAWRVAPAGARYPVAMVGAKKGDLLFFDSGVRTSNDALFGPPAVAAPPGFSGIWLSEACGTRRGTRALILEADGTFTLTDSGRASYRGRWTSPRPGRVSLRFDSGDTGRTPSLPRELGFDTGSGTLHEATPGAGRLCAYERKGDTP
jgi:hypothetical protein